MKLPATPPPTLEIVSRMLLKAADDLKSNDVTLFQKFAEASPTDAAGRYLHWDDFRFREPPAGLDPESHWAITRYARNLKITPTPFRDTTGNNFGFNTTNGINRQLHEFDSAARGGLQSRSTLPTEQETDSFLVTSLIEEPFNSSLLEGAATTRAQAKRLIRENIMPRTEGERMVINNYRAIQFIKSQKGEKLTPAIINELQLILTTGTLDDERKAGQLRNDNDNINVVDTITNEILHGPPAAHELPQRMQRLCDFANDDDRNGPFIHPIIRAIILHFMLAYDHPYVDGNGRTARALFYWSVVKDGYWLLEFVSISKIINEAPVKYGTAFLHTETDNGDLTYFIVHQLDVIEKAIAELNKFITRKQQQVSTLGEAINTGILKNKFNHRQASILNESIRSANLIFTIIEHQKIHRISYLTARKDLEQLCEHGFLAKSKYGKRSIYKPAKNITAMLKADPRK